MSGARPIELATAAATTVVNGIVDPDEGVVADEREPAVPGIGTLTLILPRRGCDGIRHVATEDERGSSDKDVQRKTGTQCLRRRTGRTGRE